MIINKDNENQIVLFKTTPEEDMHRRQLMLYMVILNIDVGSIFYIQSAKTITIYSASILNENRLYYSFYRNLIVRNIYYLSIPIKNSLSSYKDFDKEIYYTYLFDLKKHLKNDMKVDKRKISNLLQISQEKPERVRTIFNFVNQKIYPYLLSDDIEYDVYKIISNRNKEIILVCAQSLHTLLNICQYLKLANIIYLLYYNNNFYTSIHHYNEFKQVNVFLCTFLGFYHSIFNQKSKKRINISIILNDSSDPLDTYDAIGPLIISDEYIKIRKRYYSKISQDE
jgi:hypothetical protein